MASLGHIAVGVAAARFAQHRLADRPIPLVPAMLILSGLSFLPDADVVAFSFGIPYEAPLGHRGASHSLAFALATGALAALVAWPTRLRALRTGALVALVVATHGFLDMLTGGGKGVAYFWPFSDARHFLPWRPITAAPIGMGFLSAEGLECARDELFGFAPLWGYAFWPRVRARGSGGSPEATRGEAPPAPPPA